MFDRFVPKGWPPVERSGKRPLQAGLSPLGTRREKSRVSAVLFYSSGLTSQSTLLTTTRPTFWQETANHFDHLQSLKIVPKFWLFRASGAARWLAILSSMNRSTGKQNLVEGCSDADRSLFLVFPA
jgi:hypothetical protein